MQNVLVANNTFVDATGTAPGAAFSIAAPTGISHVNARIANNIIVQDDSKAIGSLASPADGLTFSHNIWSKSPPSSMMGTRSIVDDPLVTRAGTVAPGALTGDYFRIAAGSPAIDAAAALAEVTDDYFGDPRPVGASPDMGGYEYDSTGGTESAGSPTTGR
jgi:hypothetical protein